MVFFTCNHCGDSVKKPAVEKHYNTKCRNVTVNVSCMDCQKDFLGNAHVAHTKCITEAEKYSGKDFVPKVSKNNNAKKQDSWIEVVRSILQSSEYKMNKNVRAVFEKLQHHENVPRKKPKFENFAFKCLRIQKSIISDVWAVLEKELQKMEAARKQQLEEQKLTQNNSKKTDDNVVKAEPITNGIKRQSTQNGNTDEPAKKMKKKQLDADSEEVVEHQSKKKKKQKENNNVSDGEQPAKKKKQHIIEAEDATVEKKQQSADHNNIVTTNDTLDDDGEDFKWLEVLEKLIRKQGDAGIALDKLQSKVLKKYLSKLGLEELTGKQQKKFTKKFTKHLKNCTNVVINNDVVKVV